VDCAMYALTASHKGPRPTDTPCLCSSTDRHTHRCRQAGRQTDERRGHHSRQDYCWVGYAGIAVKRTSRRLTCGSLVVSTIFQKDKCVCVYCRSANMHMPTNHSVSCVRSIGPICLFRHCPRTYHPTPSPAPVVRPSRRSHLLHAFSHSHPLRACH
jgi:hypothetical protein